MLLHAAGSSCFNSICCWQALRPTALINRRTAIAAGKFVLQLYGAARRAAMGPVSELINLGGKPAIRRLYPFLVAAG